MELHKPKPTKNRIDDRGLLKIHSLCCDNSPKLPEQLLERQEVVHKYCTQLHEQAVWTLLVIQ